MGTTSSPPEWWYSVVSGDRLAAFYKWHACGEGTRRNHAGSMSRFRSFCRTKNISSRMPISTATADAWIASMGSSIQVNTIRQHLSALRTAHTEAGHEATQLTHPTIERTVRGIKRYHGVRSTKKAFPITLPVLERIIDALDNYPSLAGGRWNSVTCAAAFCLAFAGFFRFGELTYNTFDAASNIRRADAEPAAGRVFLPSSKTDPFRQGTWVTLPTLASRRIDPIRRLTDMIQRCPSDPDGPLFVLENGKAFSKATVVPVLRSCLQEAGYNGREFTGHSFRRGAATWASSIGLRDVEIMKLGRWSSTAWKEYVDTTNGDRLAMVNKVFSADLARRSTLPTDGTAPKRVHWAPTA